MKKLILLFIFIFAVSTQAQLFKSNQRAHQIEAEYKAELLRKIQINNYLVTENQKKYDVTYYDLNLDLDPDSKMLTGILTMQAIVVNDPIEFVELDLLDNMQVDSVFSNNLKQTSSHSDDILIVTLDRAYNIGELFNIKIYYHGNPRTSGFGSFAFDRYNGKHMIWTLSEPFGARNWWPCKDAPVDKADSVDIKVTVPNPMIVASNGNLVETIEEPSTTTYWWHEQYPITTYLVSLAIYEYDLVYDYYVYAENDTMPLHFYNFPDLSSQVKQANLQVKDMIKFFSETFGQYPYIKEKYGHAMFLWGGGMEHQTLTSLGYYGEDIIAHELAHQWWGDMVTCEDFHHIWLNEGFATYSEALWFEHTMGPEGRKWAQNATKYFGPGTIYVEDTENDDIFSGALSYNKASWVVQMLRYYMGDETFFAFLKNYYEQFKYSTATTEQFRDLAEQVSGLELDTFFQQWIYEEGHPVYEYLWTSEDVGNGQHKVSGIINQVQEYPTIFELPIDLTIQTNENEVVERIFIDQKSTFFEFTLDSAPTEILLDRDEWILCRIQQITTPIFESTQLAIADSTGNKNGEFEPGEQAELVIELKNIGLPANGVTGKLTTDEADINIISNTATFGNFGIGGKSSNTGTPFVLSARSKATSHIAKLVLKLQSEEGYSTDLKVYLNLGQANILLVDDDNGVNYEQHVQQFAVDAALLTKTCDVANSTELTLENMQKYQVVVWFTGDDNRTSLTESEQALITNYLAVGGRLLLSGQNIGYDLVEDGTPTDTLFYSSVLHARYVYNKTNEYMIIGNRQDPDFRNAVVYLTGDYGGAGNQNSTDVVVPIAPAEIAYTYIPSFDISGIKYRDVTTGARLIYTTFGIEGIAGPTPWSAGTMLKAAVTWLLGELTSVKSTDMSIPTDFDLNQNYPNPFNPTTSITYSIPQTGLVETTIYNAVGQAVKTLTNTVKGQGWHTIQWDGTNDAGSQVASGVYILSLKYYSGNSSQEIKTIKMLKLQ